MKYTTLRKIIPSDQALANEALSRALRQVKDVFRADLPTLAQVVVNLESNKDLNLINSLTEPLPANVRSFYSNTFATGTGPGNSVTVSDVIGTAAGNTINAELPTVISTVSALGNAGALVSLNANAGTPGSSLNGLYTQMQYCLAEAYGNNMTGISIPATTYFSGGSFTDFDDAFGNGLIPAANSAISNIAAAYANQAAVTNAAYANMAVQLEYNVTNCVAAGIDIGNLVSNIANANIESNSASSVMSFVSNLHEIGLDVSEGGQAQFVQEISNVSTLSGQAVIASMREGRNIAILNAAGIVLDTQVSDVNVVTPIANNLTSAQYTVAEARANVII
jgi:hypothetical protein